MNCPKIEAIHPKTVEPLGYFCNIWGVRMTVKGVDDYDITI